MAWTGKWIFLVLALYNQLDSDLSRQKTLSQKKNAIAHNGRYLRCDQANKNGGYYHREHA